MLRVERLRQNRCDAGETRLHLVLGQAEAIASVIMSEVCGRRRIETRLPRFGNAAPKEQ